METCNVCGGPIQVQIFKGTGSCSQICRKIRHNLYNRVTAFQEVDRYFTGMRLNSARKYIDRHYPIKLIVEDLY